MIGINGIENMLFSKIPERSTVLVHGDAGVLKTTFVMECVKEMLKKDLDKICLYLSLKDEPDFLKEHFSLHQLMDQGKILIKNYDFVMDEIPDRYPNLNHLEGISTYLKEMKKKYKDQLAFFVLDPINILFNSISPDSFRKNLYRFFSNIAQLGTQNWLVRETIEEAENVPLHPCHFLADGLIHLGMMETSSDVIRYIEIQKMRGVHHSLKCFQISYKKKVLRILGATYK